LSFIFIFFTAQTMNLSGAEKFILDKLKSDLPEGLTYHSYRHVMDVLQAARTYADMEGIDEYEQQLLQTAVLFHDAGFIIQSRDHELYGCEIARKNLPDFGYTQEEIERICGMIMATKIPQSPQNVCEQIICDADLDYLGRDDFWNIGNELYRELSVYGVLNNEQDWNRLQLKFLTGHHYFTPSAIKLRKEKKDLHTEMIRNIVNSY
jgi:predicted metal-dependent HD superfamily phosphohydrolase